MVAKKLWLWYHFEHFWHIVLLSQWVSSLWHCQMLLFSTIFRPFMMHSSIISAKICITVGAHIRCQILPNNTQSELTRWWTQPPEFNFLSSFITPPNLLRQFWGISPLVQSYETVHLLLLKQKFNRQFFNSSAPSEQHWEPCWSKTSTSTCSPTLWLPATVNKAKSLLSLSSSDFKGGLA